VNALSVQLVHDEFQSEALAAAVSDILDSNLLAAMATTRGQDSYIHTAYFVYTETLNLYFLSAPTDVHIANTNANPSIAAAIWCQANWGEDLRGLQIFGTCEPLSRLSRETATAMTLFLRRFPACQNVFRRPGEFVSNVSLRLYAIRTNRLKILHEPILGHRQFVTVDVQR
jgi:uncharacterized protein YhbP (UPF0306 family)